jgi:hypothetical protein
VESKIWDIANSHAQKYWGENPDATLDAVTEYAITKLAEELGAKVYKTSEGESQTDVKQIATEHEYPENKEEN